MGKVAKITKMLNYVGGSLYDTPRSFSERNLILNAIDKVKSIKVISIKPIGLINELRYDKLELDWEKIRKQDNLFSTYDGCTDFAFHLRGKKLSVLITIWDGDMVYGDKTKKRVVVEIEAPIGILVNHQSIDVLRRRTNHVANVNYDIMLNKQRYDWVEAQLKDVLA